MDLPAAWHNKGIVMTQMNIVDDSLFGGVVFIEGCSRAQAIDDGFLVDLMQGDFLDVCKQHFKFPIACTTTVFEIIKKAVENPKYANDYAGVLHDILYMSKVNSRSLSESIKLFQVIIRGAGRKQIYTFKLCCGPGDSREPVITIMMPNED
jgi:hypothetical protein